MSRPHRVPRDLTDAAAVHAARDAVVQALGPLAASPLDEHATSSMKVALERVESPAVRHAIRRLGRPGESRPPLQAVPPMTAEWTAGARPEPLPRIHSAVQFTDMALAVPRGAA